jgi:acetyl-CoA carboxylase carboxyltransferase component
MSAQSFSRLTAIERATALADLGTLELLPVDAAKRTTLVTARGRIDGCDAVLVLTDGRQRGGTVGVAEAQQFSHALGVAERRRCAVVVCWDTGGVRVQEGPAALAATSAVGVALTQLALRRAAVVSVVSGPRGCFGAPAVIAASGQATIMTANALWGLTGPELLDAGAEAADAARAVMSAAARRRSGHATAAVADTPGAVRRQVARTLARPLQRVAGRTVLDSCVRSTAALVRQLSQPVASADDDAGRGMRRPRDFFVYSFRGQWQQSGPGIRMGHVHAAWGELSGSPTMAIIIGPERSNEGFGVADAHAVLRAVDAAVASSRGTAAPIITFLFCRGHANTLDDERAGLPRALAECLRGLVAARLLGHPLLCVLGGGAYGAAYLTLAAPCHRILAIRGTTVAPMAPRVLAAFQRLRGIRAAPETSPDLARMIPQIRIVESVVRLQRVLVDELGVARAAAAATPALRRFIAG